MKILQSNINYVGSLLKFWKDYVPNYIKKFCINFVKRLFIGYLFNKHEI